MHPTIALAGGVELPRVGLGTFKAGGAELRAAVHAALAAGIRHIDTAAIYKVRPAGVRSELDRSEAVAAVHRSGHGTPNNENLSVA
jgi:diketogulonate reductase-like aldo/keto reductase